MVMLSNSESIDKRYKPNRKIKKNETEILSVSANQKIGIPSNSNSLDRFQILLNNQSGSIRFRVVRGYYC